MTGNEKHKLANRTGAATQSKTDMTHHAVFG